VRVAILYICTGKYDMFWPEFYESSESKFLPGIEKHYYVFSDTTKIGNTDRIHIVHQEPLDWPLITLFRFKMFCSISEKLREYDFLFFMNANMYINESIGEEILPFKEKLCVTLHPGQFAQRKSSEYPYERNPASTAYIKKNEGAHYFMGGLNGGAAKEYLDMCFELNSNILKDLRHNIIAVWHDESHLNHYMKDRTPKILDPGYGYPDGWTIPFPPRIIIRDKTKYGGHDILRDITRDCSEVPNKPAGIAKLRSAFSGVKHRIFK